MNTLSQNPKDYYAVLGLAPGADLAAIKAAYRARVKAVHPDHNQTADAILEFQRLSEAYHALQEDFLRADSDAMGPAPLNDDRDVYPLTPFACSCCGAITAQPRYVVFHRVRSYLLWAKHSRKGGIFCRDCADAAAVRASTLTWALGWWSLPGLFMTPLALLRNLFGGTKPRDQNARLLIRQARAFLAMEEPEIAYAVNEQAVGFARQPLHRQQLEDVRARITGPRRRLRDRWRPWATGVFTAQLLPLVALPMLVAMITLIVIKPWNEPIAASAEIAVIPTEIGEIRHVAIADLKMRQFAFEGAPVLALLDRFTAVQVLDTDGNQWSRVRAPSGGEGWVQTRALYAGSGSLFKQEWCVANRGTPPQSGEVLVRRAGGEHRLMIHNDASRDAVVKLKTASGNTAVAFYVPATYHIVVSGIPDGTFHIQFATGVGYSRGCGLFINEMRAESMPFTLTYRQVSAARSPSANVPEINVATPAGAPHQPQPLDIDTFAADD